MHIWLQTELHSLIKKFSGPFLMWGEIQQTDCTPQYQVWGGVGIVTGSGVLRNFVRGGVQQIQLRTEGKENGVLGAVA
jgi:hypothetical protein